VAWFVDIDWFVIPRGAPGPVKTGIRGVGNISPALSPEVAAHYQVATNGNRIERQKAQRRRAVSVEAILLAKQRVDGGRRSEAGNCAVLRQHAQTTVAPPHAAGLHCTGHLLEPSGRPAIADSQEAQVLACAGICAHVHLAYKRIRAITDDQSGRRATTIEGRLQC